MTSGAHRLSNVDLKDRILLIELIVVGLHMANLNQLMCYSHSNLIGVGKIIMFVLLRLLGIILDTHLHMHLQHDDFNELAEKQDTNKVPVKSLQAELQHRLWRCVIPNLLIKAGCFRTLQLFSNQ